ncbi:hypothetical protein BG57_25915 [Caballeronia grimmiae]|uniref:Uncharacterized protein n=1 Tax=Caballeronia grimmiae TaxID=1071679 RepID=A0A069NEF5_9BURK|nr:hypothetical protein BG57_25915 [Caballeronia grimmiae]
MRCHDGVGHDLPQTDFEPRLNIRDCAPFQAAVCMPNMRANAYPRLHSEIRYANYIAFEDYLFHGLMQCRLRCVLAIRCG